MYFSSSGPVLESQPHMEMLLTFLVRRFRYLNTTFQMVSLTDAFEGTMGKLTYRTLDEHYTKSNFFFLAVKFFVELL